MTQLKRLTGKFLAAAALGFVLLAPAFAQTRPATQVFDRGRDASLPVSLEAATKEGYTQRAEITIEVSRSDLDKSPDPLVKRAALTHGLAQEWKTFVGGLTAAQVGQYIPSDPFRDAAAQDLQKYADKLYAETGVHVKFEINSLRAPLPGR